MPRVRAGAEKWQQNAGRAGQAYLQGASNPRVPWAQATQAGAQNYAQGVQAAIVNNSFAKGVAVAGDAAWQQGIADLGSVRFQQGVQSAKSAQRYTKGFAPYRAAIESLQLTPRGPRGDPSNYNRVAQVGQTLNAVRQQIKKG